MSDSKMTFQVGDVVSIEVNSGGHRIVGKVSETPDRKESDFYSVVFGCGTEKTYVGIEMQKISRNKELTNWKKYWDAVQFFRKKEEARSDSEIDWQKEAEFFCKLAVQNRKEIERLKRHYICNINGMINQLHILKDEFKTGSDNE